MASQYCRFCQSKMYPCDGHRECPSCLGMAHLKEDVDNPCSAACDLPREERLRRVARVHSLGPERDRERERPDRPGHKRSHKNSRDRRHKSPPRSSREEGRDTANCSSPAPAAEGGSDMTPGQDGVPPPGPQDHAGEAGTDEADALSLFAPHSLF